MRTWVGVAADGRGEEDAVAPDDRARVAEAGDRRLPADVRPVLHVPGDRRVLAVGDAGRVRPAELRPVRRLDRLAPADVLRRIVDLRDGLRPAG